MSAPGASRKDPATVSSAELNLITRLRLLPAVLGVGAALLVSGCGAGQIAQTDTQVPAVNGSMGTVKQMAVRDAQLAFPLPNGYYQRRDDATLLVTIANSGPTTDTLTNVTSPAFSSVRLQGDPSVPGHAAVRATGNVAQPLTSAASTTGSALPVGTIRIQLVGLTLDKLQPGQTVQITFTFANSGDVTLNVPIANDPRPRVDNG
jgi:copper(I)-binding protein